MAGERAQITKLQIKYSALFHRRYAPGIEADSRYLLLLACTASESHQQKERRHSQMAHCKFPPPPPALCLPLQPASIQMEVCTGTANSMNKICKSYELIEEATRFHRTCIASQKPPENSDSPLAGWLSDCCRRRRHGQR